MKQHLTHCPFSSVRQGLCACVCGAQVAVVSAFAQTLRRYTSLNHLAQAARAVLQNTSQINQMLSDLNRVDFANVQVKSQPLSASAVSIPVFGGVKTC